MPGREIRCGLSIRWLSPGREKPSGWPAIPAARASSVLTRRNLTSRGRATCRSSERPIVVGSGPGGLLAAYYLAVRGYRPLVLERGEPVKERVPAIRAFDRGGPLDRENNYLFGEGGAGTFSDGKLTCRMSGPDVDWVLERFVECGGKPEIRYEQRPHLGSNRLPMLVRNFRRKIEALGGEYRFRCRMEELDIADGRVRGVQHFERLLSGVGGGSGDWAQRPRHLRNAAPPRRADAAEGVSARPADRAAAGRR